MQAGGGRRRAPFILRIYGLITASVRKLFGNIRRKRHGAYPVKYLVEDAGIAERNNARTVIADRGNDARKPFAVYNGIADTCLFSGAGKTLPHLALCPGNTAKKHRFHPGAAARRNAENPCGYNLGVVYYKYVAGAEILCYIAENAVGNTARMPVQHEHPR